MTAGALIVARFAQLLLLGILCGAPLMGHTDRRSLIVLAIAGAVASVAGMAALAADMSGIVLTALDWDTFSAVATMAGPGVAFEVRIAALSAIAIVAILFPAASRPAAATGGAVALASLAWSGHAAGSDGAVGAVHLVADIIHMIAAGAWLGALALFVRDSVCGLTPERVARLAAFARTGTIIVLILMVTGAANLVFIMGLQPPSSVLASRWTWLLALKLIAFAIMLLLAARHRFSLVPALAGGANRMQAMRASLAAEFGLGLAIVGLVAWAGRLDPAGG